MIERRPVKSYDDAIFEARTGTGDDPDNAGWFSLSHTYGEGNSIERLAMSADEFRWLIEEAGPRLLATIEDDDGLCPHGMPFEFCGNCHEDEVAASDEDQREPA